jgi:hypothetical protein
MFKKILERPRNRWKERPTSEWRSLRMRPNEPEANERRKVDNFFRTGQERFVVLSNRRSGEIFPL